MALTKVGPKFQVTIPKAAREAVGIRTGDLVEARVERGKITLTPKSLVDRDIEISLQQLREGKVSLAFTSARGLIKHLHRQAKKLKKTK